MTQPEPPTVRQLEERIVILESDRHSRGWVTLLVCLGITLALVAGGVWVQNQNNRSIARERMAREASERAREASNLAFCGIIVLLDNAYSKAKPGTLSPVGQELANAIAYARTVNHCVPRTN